MLRLLTILIASMLIGNAAAAFTKSTCNVFEDYVYNQNVLIKAVDKEIIKAGKQTKWFQGNLDCKSVQIEKTGPKSANLRVLVNVSCYGYMPVTEYVCYDSNNKAVGNEQFLIDFSATCYKENNQSDSCLKVTGIKRMTKPTPAPAPVPQNKWIPINYDFIPKDVRDAAVKYVREVTTLNKYKPGPADSYLYTGNAFRKESAAVTAYRIKGAAVTGRLIKNCPYPFMTQDLDVAIAKAKTGGALTKLPKDNILRKITIVTGSDDEDWTGKCDKTPEAKKALEQAKAFIAANSPK